MIPYIVAHAVICLVSYYMLYQEYKYCKNESWWSNGLSIMTMLVDLVPIGGVFLAAGSIIDYHRNITKAIVKRNLEQLQAINNETSELHKQVIILSRKFNLE